MRSHVSTWVFCVPLAMFVLVGCLTFKSDFVNGERTPSAMVGGEAKHKRQQPWQLSQQHISYCGL